MLSSTCLRVILNHPYHNLSSYEDLFVRRSVSYALGVIKDKAALSPLINIIASQRSFVCETAVFALGEIGGEDLTEPLSKILDESSPYLRGYVAEALGKIGSYNSLPILLDLINDPSDFVREMTAQAIGRFEDAKTIPILLNTLLDKNRFVRRKALESLKGIAFDGDFLSSDIMKDEDSVVRKNAISLFESIGDNVSISKIFIALQDKDVDVRAWAIRALKKVGTPILISPLRSMASGGGEDMLNLISAIQSRCKFYNYEIWQTYLAGQQGDSTPSQSDKMIANTITIQTVEKLTIMSDKAPVFNQQHATIGVNYAAEGSQQDFTQHIHAPEQNFEILLTGYKHFIEELQQQNPHLTNEAAIIQTIDIEAKRIDTRWQNFLNLKRLWNGSKKAAIKVGEHFVESNPWGKGAIAFLEGISEDVK